MYHTMYHFLPPYPKAARMARRVVNLLLIQDLLCAGHYAAVFRNYGAHYGLNKPLCDYDATPLPWGATFGCLGSLLADAEPVDHVPLGDTGQLAHVFRIGERYGFVTYATCVADYDQHFRPADREIRRVRFGCAQGSVDVLDMFWNPRGDAAWEGDVLRLDLNEEPVFFLDRSLGREGLMALIAGSRRPPRPCELGIALVPGREEGRIDLAVTLRNNTGRAMRRVALDLRNPRSSFTTSGEWLLARPYGDAGDVPAGGGTTVRFATVLDGRAPYEGGRIRVHLYSAEGWQPAKDETLWLIPAARVEAAVDGRLDEWRHRTAAWLAYVWTVMPMGRFQVQFHENAEHFSYPSYGLDARAMVWAGYDDAHLYLALRIEDDQPLLSRESGERLRLVLDTGDGPAAFELAPLPNGEVAVSGPGAEAVRARCRQESEIIHDGAALAETTIRPVLLEAALPWSVVGGPPEPGSILGFDLFWTDVDEEDGERVGGTLRWAGGAERGGWLRLVP
jgi:hypothetical protein